MRLYQKIVIGVLSTLAIAIVSLTVYGVKMYYDTNSTFNNIFQASNRRSKKRESEVKFEERDPFSVLLLGIDTGDLGRTDQGRSDSIMVATINPKKKESALVSLDRDIYTNMVGYHMMDKLNHAYAYGGVEMSMDSVEHLLDIPIDHYVTINMRGMKDLIDAVGGIEVDNKIDFTLEGVHVPKGKIKLNGETGLAYARMRYDDPEGDIGRQRRQREIVEKIVMKALSFEGVANYDKILKAIEKNSKTDLSWNDIMDIVKNYPPAFENIKQYQLEGSSEMIDEVYYQLLTPEELLDMQNILKEQLDMPTSKILPVADEAIVDSNLQTYELNDYYPPVGEEAFADDPNEVIIDHQ